MRPLGVIGDDHLTVTVEDERTDGCENVSQRREIEALQQDNKGTSSGGRRNTHRLEEEGESDDRPSRGPRDAIFD